jgi:hypothetical protein
VAEKDRKLEFRQQVGDRAKEYVETNQRLFRYHRENPRGEATGAALLAVDNGNQLLGEF